MKLFHRQPTADEASRMTENYVHPSTILELLDHLSVVNNQLFAGYDAFVEARDARLEAVPVEILPTSASEVVKQQWTDIMSMSNTITEKHCQKIYQAVAQARAVMVTNVMNSKMRATPGAAPPAKGHKYTHIEAMEFLQRMSPEKVPPLATSLMIELIGRLRDIAISLDKETQKLTMGILESTLGLPEVQSSTLLRTLVSLPAQWILRAHPRTSHNSKGIHLFYFPDLHDDTERVRELVEHL
ncbi:hypothetical protein LTR99_005192 [Exophiala xenobiotica]|nr:hypothetical protein LTR99_005192 [Exophiala xenobiotica]KAK5436533.1 hypothetical protein LTR34_002164 [Exophiala xenobiotica]